MGYTKEYSRHYIDVCRTLDDGKKEMIGIVAFYEGIGRQAFLNKQGHYCAYLICPEVKMIEVLFKSIADTVDPKLNGYVDVTLDEYDYWSDVVSVHGGVTFVGTKCEKPCIGWDYCHHDSPVDIDENYVMDSIIEAYNELEQWRIRMARDNED